jgi:alcohol dehydrogenase
MKTLCVIKPGEIEFREVELPAIGPYQARVKNEAVSLCNSTDSKIISGKFPGLEEMPISLGHEGAGIIVETGSKVRNFQVGERAIGGLLFEFSDPGLVSGWGGFSEYVLVNDHAAMVEDGVADEEHDWFECYEIQTVVDKDIPVEEAALLCTWREVYGGIGDFNIRPENNLLVIGAGMVGLSFIKFLSLMGQHHITSVDPLEMKREKAISFGANEVYSSVEDIIEAADKKFDVVIDAVGSVNIINAGIKLVKMGGTLGVYGVLGPGELRLEKDPGPFNFNLLMHQWPTRWRERAAQDPLCEWIRQGKLKADNFLTHRYPIEKIDLALSAIKDGTLLKSILTF